MCVCVCVSQGTFSSFYYFKHRDQYIFIFKCTNLKVVSHITLIVLVIGKAQFRRAMLSCDSSCSSDPFHTSGNEDMHKSLDEFEIWPDPITGFRGNK